MRHTLKAVFAHRSDAQHVLDELLASGYSPADTALSNELPTTQDDDAGLDGADAKAGGPVKRLAARLFHTGQREHSAAYSDAFARGRQVVTLSADSEPAIARAAAIIERFGPLGIETQDEVREHGSVGAGRMTRAYPPGTEPGALQGRAQDDSRYFGTQRADSPPTGNTFQEIMGADSQWLHPDDGRLHVHAPATFADSHGALRDDDMAAFRYGKEMRISDKYRNRSWDEVEPALRNGWEAGANGAAAWDESRNTVRRGWNSTSPDIDDDSYYRTHWNAIYAHDAGDSEEKDHAPASLSGSEAQRSENYRSRDWRSSPSDAEDAWNARHAGQLSSWGNFKNAVTHGWNRIRLDTDTQEPGDPSHDAMPGTGTTHMATPEAPEEPGHAGSAAPAWDKVKAAVRHGPFKRKSP